MSLTSLYRGLWSLLLHFSSVGASTIRITSRQAPTQLFSRADLTQCALASDTPCYQGLPADVCCSSDEKCLVVAANTTAICVPTGFELTDVSFIRPITCNIALQDWREHPDAPIKTIALDHELDTCGQGACCPHGYICDSSNTDGSRCVLDVSVDADDNYQDLRPESIPIVTSYQTASPTAIDLNPDPEKTPGPTDSDSEQTPTPTSAGNNVVTGILTLSVPSNTAGFRAADTGQAPLPSTSDDPSPGDDSDGDNLSVGLIIGVSIAAAITAGLAVFLYLRRNQLFRARATPKTIIPWPDAASITSSSRAPRRFRTPFAEMDGKSSCIPEMAVRDYNTTEMPAESPPCELPSPVHVVVPRRMPSELQGSPVDRRASVVPLSVWNTRDVGRFERVKVHWYQRRGG